MPLFALAGAIGAALAYFFDPDNGRRRRKIFGDKAGKYVRQTGKQAQGVSDGRRAGVALLEQGRVADHYGGPGQGGQVAQGVAELAVGHAAHEVGDGLALDHGHHVLRIYCKNLVGRLYEKFSTFLRVELCANRMKDLGLNKGLKNLE